MKRIHLLLYIALVMLAAACGSDSNTSTPVVCVSIAPQKYIVEQIAGDRMEVRTLLSQGANPETYEPAMSHLLNLEKSRAYLRMGYMGFEDAILEKVSASSPNLPIYNLSDGVELIEGTHHSCADHEAQHHHHAKAEVDPHVWSSVANARIMARNAMEALSEVDPEGAEYYRSNYNRFTQHLDSLDTEIRTILRDAPARQFIVWHPSLSYFARDYSLEQISLGSENKELSIPALRAKIDAATGAAAAVAMLLQRDYDIRQAEVVNREIGAHIEYINPLNADWEEELLHTARAIANSER